MASTRPFNKVEQGTIRVRLGSRDVLRVSVNTDEFFLTLVGVMFSHQVPMILLGPSGWTMGIINIEPRDST